MPVGAVGAIMGARRARQNNGGGWRGTPMSQAEQERLRVALEEQRKKAHYTKMIRKFDKNKSGKLERDQLVAFLTDLDSSTPPGTQPSAEEVDFILKAADAAGDGCIDARELPDVIACWNTYADLRDKLDEAMKQYDVSGTGTLSKEEIKAYLIHLNGDKEVTDTEVEMVFKEADVLGDGVINKQELSRATACWYGYLEKKNSCCSVL